MRIIEYLSPRDVDALRLVSKRMNALVDQVLHTRQRQQRLPEWTVVLTGTAIKLDEHLQQFAARRFPESPTPAQKVPFASESGIEVFQPSA